MTSLKISLKKLYILLKEEEIEQHHNALEDAMMLREIYQHIHPFQDDREYLAIGPGDFVILSEKSYKLVNNSFLLLGFKIIN